MSEDHEVGYGKPPKKNQFKKGQSGNPKGRPKQSRSHSVLMEEELGQRITVKEGNKKITMTKREAIVKQLINKAIKGDNRATKTVLDHCQDIEPESEVSQPLSIHDEKLLGRFFDKQRLVHAWSDT